MKVQPDTILRERHIRALVRDLGVLFLCILPMWSFWIPPHIVLSILFRPFDLNGWRSHRFLDEAVCQYRGISYHKEIENPRNFYAIFAAAVEEEANAASFSAMRAACFVNPSQYLPSVAHAPPSDRARIPPSGRVPMG